MSSPLTLRDDASSPPVLHVAGESQDPESMDSDVQRRFMRVKVLYTFDDQNKTNCLARLPNPLSIPTVYLDDQTQVGLIELKDCIEAIVAASPEIITRLQNDYTVYAYDFSEYETPLVGQGLLSRVLALASPTPIAPANQSRTMITGRVCKNILGLFSNGIKETLEVKLKLVPVPSCAQSEYLKSMEQYRNMGAEVSGAQAGSMSNRSNSGGVESINQLLYANPNLAEDRRQPLFSQEDEDYALSTAPGSVQGSRAGSPTPSLRSCAALQQVTQGGVSRPSSRASIQSERPSRSQRGSIDASHTLEQSREEGPVRKRARVTQTDWRGRSSFGANSDSLRVTASTAASIRVHRPVAINPAVEGNTEAPPRAPTPRPDRHSVPQSRGRPALRSSLRHESSYEGLTQTSQYQTQKPQRYISPYPIADDFPPQPDSAMYSGEDEGGNTPSPDFPSSPPEYAPRTTSLAPSSPGLPTLPYQSDSGFMSDAAILPEEDGVPTANPESSRPPADPNRDFRLNLQKPWKSMLPGPESLLPTKILPRPVHHRQMMAAERRAAAAAAAAQNNNAEAKAPIPSSPSLQPRPANVDELQSTMYPPQQSCQPDPVSVSSATPEQSFTDHLQQQVTSIAALSANTVEVNTGDMITQVDAPVGIPTTTVKPRKPRRLQRADSDASQVFQSDAPYETTTGSGTAEEPRSGSGAKRKKTIQNALAASLAAGEMPQFCSNCGEINTPTWRKAFTKVEQGAPTDVQLSNEKGGIIGYEVLSKDDSGVVTSYRIYKKSQTASEIKDNTMETLLMCNPCGIWFHTKGTMRPPELWVKNPPRDPAEKKPRRRQSKKKSQGNDDCPTSDIYEEQAPAFGPRPPSAVDGAEDLPQKPALQPLAPRQPRAASVQLDTGVPPTNGQWNSLDAAALKRAIQSSPARFLGSQQSPIELDADLTPQPVRRLLFPSPRKEGEVKSLEDSPSVSPTKSREQAAQNAAESLLLPELLGLNQDDKENCPPDDFDGLAHLFEGSEPNTPRSSARSSQIFADLLKTPTPRSTRTGLTPRNSTGNRNNSVGLLTPSRKAQQNLLAAPVTPFTAHLNQLLSDGLTSSPSKLFDFPMPTFDTPNKSGTLNFGDFGAEDLLSTDLQMPSSPPGVFSLYEDPNTSTAGLWGGTSIFDGGAAAQEMMGGEEATGTEGAAVDFAVVIEQVVGGQ